MRLNSAILKSASLSMGGVGPRVSFRNLKVGKPFRTTGKVVLSGGKSFSPEYSTSNSFRAIIERSRTPKGVLRSNKKMTEPIYMGGNTASNMSGGLRSANKELNLSRGIR